MVFNNLGEQRPVVPLPLNAYSFTIIMINRYLEEIILLLKFLITGIHNQILPFGYAVFSYLLDYITYKLAYYCAVYCIVATKFVSQEVIYPDKLLVVDKNRTAFVFYEMNNKPESTSYKSNPATTASYKHSYVSLLDNKRYLYLLKHQNFGHSSTFEGADLIGSINEPIKISEPIKMF